MALCHTSVLPSAALMNYLRKALHGVQVGIISREAICIDGAKTLPQVSAIDVLQSYKRS